MADNLQVFVPLPQAPCKACVENARHQSEDVGIVWCKHTRWGGIYMVEQGTWTTTGPFANEQQFKRSMMNSVLRVAAVKTSGPS